MKFQTIYFLAGEVSADNHGAALMRSLHELDNNLKFVGRGGPEMQKLAGESFKNWISEAAVLGLWEVLWKYGYFREQFYETLREIESSKADAVVLIDYPGFNLRVARALRKQAAPNKIIYYISPQVWAWNRGRIRRMAHWIDLVLCIFPFEADLYNQAGLRALFVGHPMIERLQARKAADQRDPNLIGLFPGSRSREVRKIFPVMLETARDLQKENPNLRFEIAAASEQLAAEMKSAVSGQEREQIFQIKLYETAAIMQRAWAGMVASGSATLEAAYFRLPFVLIYKVAWPTYLAARLVVNVKFLGMPNLLADKEIIPEFIQHRAKPNAVLQAMQPLIGNTEVRERMISQLDSIVPKLDGAGASQRAARAIVEEIRSG
ncbi:MAG TPA: lipid-A-disaccharide synthase [Candidatus Udaeobacter sp.]|jgi:lipid-A-disaccharide synthase|nr:lipid-A-disaccharide synthase [Candidatus Udaeobacter sp.]